MNKKIRKDKLQQIKRENKTIILYEAPHKLISTLKDLDGAIADRKIVLARELTKIHEEFICATAKQFSEEIDEPRGEYVIVIDKCTDFEVENFLDMSVDEHYKYYESLRICKKGYY